MKKKPDICILCKVLSHITLCDIYHNPWRKNFYLYFNDEETGLAQA